MCASRRRGASITGGMLPTSSRRGSLAAYHASSDEDHLSVVDLLLGPLLHGKQVTLVVKDSRLPKRKRSPVIRLFLVPITSTNGSIEIMAGLETHGCEVFDPRTVTKMSFIRMGLNVRLSSAMATELNKLFKRGD